jgi:hypothetical protein
MKPPIILAAEASADLGRCSNVLAGGYRVSRRAAEAANVAMLAVVTGEYDLGLDPLGWVVDDIDEHISGGRIEARGNGLEVIAGESGGRQKRESA